jgi:S1-C subfamily serine protease
MTHVPTWLWLHSLSEAGRDMDIPDNEALDAYSSVVSAVAELLTPRVAAIRVRRHVRGRTSESAGSGVVLTAEGHLITNAHVVGAGDEGEASFSDGTTAHLDVVGRDALSDLAVVRADRAVPSPPEFGEPTS